MPLGVFCRALDRLKKAIGCGGTQVILTQLQAIMSKISEFAAAQKIHNDKIDLAITGVQGDVKSLADQIAALQATSGEITAEDQALLDDIQTRSAVIVTKLEALDALTPPVAPQG